MKGTEEVCGLGVTKGEIERERETRGLVKRRRKGFGTNDQKKKGVREKKMREMKKQREKDI